MKNDIIVILIIFPIIALKCLFIQANIEFGTSSNILLYQAEQNNPYFVKNLLDFKINNTKAAFLSTNNINNYVFQNYDLLLHLVTMDLTDIPKIIINKFIQLSQKLNSANPYYFWHSKILSVDPLTIAFDQGKLN